MSVSPCIVCSMNADWSRLLNGKQSAASPRPHSCPTCHKGFPNDGALARHFQGSPMHKPRPTKASPEQCTLCQHTFADQRELARHIIDSHSVWPAAVSPKSPPPEEFCATDAQKSLKGVAAVKEFNKMKSDHAHLTSTAWCRATGTGARTFRKWKVRAKEVEKSGEQPMFTGGAKGKKKGMKALARAWIAAKTISNFCSKLDREYARKKKQKRH
jgi:hypothetical protein